MAGTAKDWKTLKVAQNAGELWANLAIPGGGAKLALHTDGTPDGTANPNAVHLGATKAGSKLMAKPKFTNYNVDEFRNPIITSIDEVELVISAELVGVTDTGLAELLTPGLGTKTTGTGFELVTFGTRSIVYTSIALVFPLIEDTTKFGVWHLYRALNDSGLEFGVGRKELGFTPVEFSRLRNHHTRCRRYRRRVLETGCLDFMNSYRQHLADKSADEKTFQVACPSDFVWQLRLYPLDKMLYAGKLPEFLASEMISAMEKKGVLPADALAAKIKGSDVLDTLKFMRDVVQFCAVKPRISLNPQNDDEIAPEEIELNDFEFIYFWAMAGGDEGKALATFRTKRDGNALSRNNGA
jgi:hypothetical protein